MDNKRNILFASFVFLMLLSSVVVAAQNFNPTDYPGTNQNNVPKNIVITESKPLTGLALFFHQIFSPQTVFLTDNYGINKGSFKPGETMHVETSQTIDESCSSASLVVEVYNAPVGQHSSGPNGECPYSGKSCVDTLTWSLGALEASQMVFRTSYEYTFPSSAKIGQWSVSSYIYCPSKNPRPVDNRIVGGYSSVDEVNFNVVTFIPTPQECGNGVIEGNEFCDSNNYPEYRNGYAGYSTCIGPGNTNACKAYSGFTATQFCGDKIVQSAAGETCDVGPSGSSTCSTSCKAISTPPPGAKYKCSNNQCTQATDGTYGESTCGGACAAAPPPDLNAPNFDVKIFEAPSVLTSEQDKVTISVDVTNLNNKEGKMFVEAGIYDDTYINTIKNNLQSVVNTDVQNCKVYETNVDTVHVTLAANEKKRVYFEVKTPKVCGVSGVGTSDTSFGYLVDTYVSCFSSDETDSGGKDYDFKDVSITKEFGLLACGGTCTDGIINQDESDTDVGGVCSKAPIDSKCNSDEDCSTGNVCLAVGGLSGTVPICRPEAERPIIRSACPVPDGAQCVPEGCPYIDVTKTTLGSPKSLNNRCCSGSVKVQTTLDSNHLAGALGAIGGGVAGTAGGLATTGVTAGWSLLVATPLGTFLGKNVGDFIYSRDTTAGFCESSGFGGNICQFNFIEKYVKDCTIAVVLQLIGIVLIVSLLKK